MKLNDLVYNYNVVVFGFPAFKGLEKFSPADKEIKNISTLSPADMLEKGITEYYYPIIPRGARFDAPEQILEADLDCIALSAVILPEELQPSRNDDVIIVSRHEATIEILKEKFPNYSKIITGNANIEDIKGKSVVGTLPGTLATYCDRYVAVTIKEYNAVTDGDISAELLGERLVIHKAIKVSQI